MSGKSRKLKELTIVDGSQNPLIGNYYGYKQSDKNTYFYVNILQNGLKNIPKETTRSYYFQNEIIYGSSAFYIAGGGAFDPDYVVYAIEGFGYLKNHNKLEIVYSYKNPTNTSGSVIVKDTFYGIKQ